MTKRTFALVLVVLVCALVAPAQADVIMIDSITSQWQNAVGGASVSINNTAALDSVRWGDNVGWGQSGYDWLPTATPFPATTGVVFSLGTFTHINQPIGSGTSISSVQLGFGVGNFVTPSTLSATFLFIHNETPNQTPCQYPSGSNPCADAVTISNAFFNAPFTNDGGGSYYFSLLGFSTNGGSTISTTFVTQEQADNHAQLYALVTPQPIPEPTSLALLGGGLVAAAARLRRRK